MHEKEARPSSQIKPVGVQFKYVRRHMEQIVKLSVNVFRLCMRTKRFFLHRKEGGSQPLAHGK